MNNEFKKKISDLTMPVNGQYPRPWMTTLNNPEDAKIFIIGLNQATEYPETALSHQRHMDALFNRNGENCRTLYAEIRSQAGKKSSPTRRNTDKLSRLLAEHGVHDILETDVICYSTRKYKDLENPEHQFGRQRGERIFKTLITEIQPPIIISHGVETTKALGRALGINLPAPNKTAEEPVIFSVDNAAYMPIIFILPSLSPHPGIVWNDACFENIANVVAPVYSNYMTYLEKQKKNYH